MRRIKSGKKYYTVVWNLASGLLFCVLLTATFLCFSVNSSAQIKVNKCSSALSYTNDYIFKAIVESKVYVEMPKEDQQLWLKLARQLANLRVRGIVAKNSKSKGLDLSRQFMKSLNNYIHKFSGNQRSLVKANTIVAVNQFQKDFFDSALGKALSSEKVKSNQDDLKKNNLKAQFVISDTNKKVSGKEHLASFGNVEMESSSSVVLEGKYHDLTGGNLGKGHRRFMGIRRSANSMIQLSDGRYMSFGGDGKVVSWELKTPLLKKLWQGEKNLVYGKDYENPMTGEDGFFGGFEIGNGRVLVFSGKTIEVLKENSKSWEQEYEIHKIMDFHSEWLKGLIPLGDGKILVWDGKNKISIWKNLDNNWVLYEVLPSPKSPFPESEIFLLELKIENGDIYGASTAFTIDTKHSVVGHPLFRWYQSELAINKSNSSNREEGEY